MKLLLKNLVLVLSVAMGFFNSCNKDKPFTYLNYYPGPWNQPQLPSNDTLKGSEFDFTENWFFWQHPNTPAFDEMCVIVEPGNNFSIPSMINYRTEVSIKLNGSTDSIIVPQRIWSGSNLNPPAVNNGFAWYKHSNDHFIVDNYPVMYQLAGTPVKVKVKFL